MWQGADRLDEWIDAKLHGPLSLEALDLTGQVRLQSMTRGFVTHFLADRALHSNLVLNQARRLFPDWSPDEPALLLADLQTERADDSVRGYLNAVMLDLALVDPDVQDAALVRAAAIARDLGSLEALQANLKRDAGFGKRELDKLKKRLGSMQVQA